MAQSLSWVVYMDPYIKKEHMMGSSAIYSQSNPQTSFVIPTSLLELVAYSSAESSTKLARGQRRKEAAAGSLFLSLECNIFCERMKSVPLAPF